jgi:uncharacterized Fe-S cluster-containing protein
MDILRNLFGSVTSGIVRLAVTAGVLLLVYLFIVKPVLKTTNDAIKSTGINDIGKTINSVNRQVQRQIRHSFKATRINGGNPQRLIHCIQRAAGDVHRIQRCTVKF